MFMRYAVWGLAGVVVGLLPQAAAADVCAPQWDAFIGTPGIAPDPPPSSYTPVVYAMHIFTLGGVERVYAGGAFDFAGGVVARNIAQWNGTAWSPLGGGRTGSVAALTNFNNALIVAGSFGDGQDIARWDGASWTSLGGGVNNAVNALTTFNDGTGNALYVGGAFTRAGSTLIVASRVAKWNGTAWSALIGPFNGTNGTVTALLGTDAASGVGNFLYVGGAFTTAGGNSALRIARWNGSAWSAMGSGFNGPVLTMAVFNDGSGPALYAGGAFTENGPGTQTFGYIARWSHATSSWSTVGGGMDGPVLSLRVFDDGTGPALYAGGEFNTAGGVSANHLARWKNGAWEAVPPGTNDHVLAITSAPNGSPRGPALYAGGLFTLAGGVESLRVGRWDPCAPVADCNNNGIPDSEELAGNDCNGNNVPDDCDLAGGDCNNNQIVDACEPDCNNNGQPDDCDVAAGANDFNSNGIPDECEPDCQPNGVPDFIDILFVSEDCNANTVPDECEYGTGDMDGDGAVDLVDYGHVAACFTGCACDDVACDPPVYGGFCCRLADFDGDGDVDLRDWSGWQNQY